MIGRRAAKTLRPDQLQRRGSDHGHLERTLCNLLEPPAGCAVYSRFPSFCELSLVLGWALVMKHVFASFLLL